MSPYTSFGAMVANGVVPAVSSGHDSQMHSALPVLSFSSLTGDPRPPLQLFLPLRFSNPKKTLLLTFFAKIYDGPIEDDIFLQ